ncbi:hypothetical protein FXB41_18760 [Bradyrhizobium canariense]|nr:hypothetical protein [Bradyrhizobium canariense]
MQHCGRAAVFVDANSNANCVPCAWPIGTQRYQGDTTFPDPAFAGRVACCLSGCTRLVRRTNVGQVANFTSGADLRQTGAAYISY